MATTQTIWFGYDGIRDNKAPWSTYSGGMPYTEGYYIKNYFKDNQITILDAKMAIHPNSIFDGDCITQRPNCFFFLVPQADAEKITRLGYKLVTLTQSDLSSLCPAIDYC